MGYFFAIAAVLLVPIMIIAIIAIRGGASPRPEKSGDHQPIGPSAPAADELTPGASATASTEQIAAAQKRVPPA
jgi:hypothetical protein